MTDLDRILRDLADQGSATAGASAPAEIRAAGDQRRRRRIGLIVAAVVLVIFGGTAAAGTAVYGLPGSQPIPVTPAGSAAPTAEETHELAEDPFLDGPFGWPGSYDELMPTGAAGELRDFCLPPLDSLGASEARTADYRGPSEAGVVSGAMEFETVQAAQDAAAEIKSLPDSCYASEPDRDTTVHEPRDRDVGDEAYVFGYESAPNAQNAGSETSYFGYGVVRDGNIVVVIEFGAMSAPVEDEPYATWSDPQLSDLITKAVA